MQTVLVIHNLMRWAVLLLGLWAILNAVSGLTSKRSFSGNDQRSSLFFMISCDLQLLLGLILYFSNSWFDKVRNDMGAVMKSSFDRFFTVEHAGVMILAWILVHAGHTAVKKANTDRAKHRKMLLYFSIAMLLIIISIPWPFRDEIARPLFRGFN